MEGAKQAEAAGRARRGRGRRVKGGGGAGFQAWQAPSHWAPGGLGSRERLMWGGEVGGETSEVD